MFQAIANWYAMYTNATMAWYVNHPVVMTISLGVCVVTFLAAVVFAITAVVKAMKM